MHTKAALIGLSELLGGGENVTFRGDMLGDMGGVEGWRLEVEMILFPGIHV